jgi:hypothetical protein
MPSAADGEVKEKVPCAVKSSNVAKNSPYLYFDRDNYDPKRIAKELSDIAPKAVSIYENIKSMPGKHVVYSADNNFLKVLCGYLISQGIEFGISEKTLKLLPKKTGKDRFVLLPGGTIFGKTIAPGRPSHKDPAKRGLKSQVVDRFNDEGNVMGEDIRILLISSAYREGLNLFDAVAMHIAEPFTREADQTQVIGRVIRRCGHSRTPWKEGGWTVTIFTYDVTLKNVSATNLTMVKSELAEKIIDMAVDLPLTPKAPDAVDNGIKHQASSKSSSSDGSYDVRYLAKPHEITRGADGLYNMNNMAAVALAHGLTPKKFEAYWKGVHGHYYNPYAEYKVTHVGDFFIYAAKKSRAIRIDLARYSTNPTKYTTLNQTMIAKTWRTWLHAHPGMSTGVERLTQKHLGLPDDFAIEEPAKQASGKPKEVTEKHVVLPEKPFASRDEMHRFIKKHWMHLAWEASAKVVTNMCTQTGGKTLSQTQKFVSQYFVPKCPFKGMIAYHSVGSGKTILGASVCQSFQNEGYKCVWITRTNIRAQVEKDFAEEHLPTSLLHRILSFKMASNAVSNNNTLLDNGKGGDLLEKVLLVIDEAHLLFNGSLPDTERANVDAIQKAVLNSYEKSGSNSCRVLAMSGTVDESDKVWNGVYTLCGSHNFGNVSYLDVRKNAGLFAIPTVKHVPVDLLESHPIIVKLNECNKEKKTAAKKPAAEKKEKKPAAEKKEKKPAAEKKEKKPAAKKKEKKPAAEKKEKKEKKPAPAKKAKKSSVST